VTVHIASFVKSSYSSLEHFAIAGYIIVLMDCTKCNKSGKCCLAYTVQDMIEVIVSALLHCSFVFCETA